MEGRALNRRAFFTTVIASLLMLLAAGCGSSPPESSSRLRFGLAQAPITLDPRFATDATSTRINRLLYDRLVDFDVSDRPVPALAQWQQVSPRHYRFTLRTPQARFHDGTALTAADVRATYASVLDSVTVSPHRASLDMIAAVTVVDERTIDFQLTRPDPLFPGRLVLGIVPARAIAAGRTLQNQPLGSGPFELVAWPHDGQLILKRNDGLEVEFLEVKNPTVRVLKLMRGELDMLQNDLPSELIGYLRGQKQVRLFSGPGSNFSYLGFNMRDPVTGDLRLRQAVAHALDREAVIKYVLGGAARPATGLLPPEHWAGHPDLPPYRHDPARARQLLAEAGYSAGHPARLVYKTSSDPFRIRLATIIQRQLGEVGIEVDLRSYDWGTFYGDIKAGRFQMFSLAWIGIKMPDIFDYAFHSNRIPPEGANRGFFSDAGIDRLIGLADAESNPQRQIGYYHEIQRRLHERLPYVPLWYEDQVFVARANVSGYTLARDGDFDGLKHVRRTGA